MGLSEGFSNDEARSTLKCQNCGTENPPDARLCISCQEILSGSFSPRQAPPLTSSPSISRFCVSCGRSIPWEANVCPYCGHNYMAPPIQYTAWEEPISSGMKILFYVLSLLFPIVGIIIGVVLILSKNSPENKHIGKMCIILALIPVLLTVVMALLLYLMVLGFGS